MNTIVLKINPKQTPVKKATPCSMDILKKAWEIEKAWIRETLLEEVEVLRLQLEQHDSVHVKEPVLLGSLQNG